MSAINIKDPNEGFLQDIEDIGFDRPCKDPLGATVELYHVHIFYCAGGDPAEYPQRLDHYFPIYAALKDEIKSREKKMQVRVKLTLCDEPENPRDDVCNLLCFGVSKTGGGRNYMSKVIGVSASAFDDFLGYIEDGKERSLMIHKLTNPYVFICSHRAKDERCGYCGPRIALAFKEAQIGSAVVRQTSHTSGHKYAANIITFPAGHWWGYVKPKDVPRLVPLLTLGLEDEPFTPESLLPGPPSGLTDLWRGRMGLSKSDQSQLTPNAKGATKGDKVKKGEKTEKSEAPRSPKGARKATEEGEDADEGKKAAKKAWKKEMKEKFFAIMATDEGAAQKFAKEMKEKFKLIVKSDKRDNEKTNEKPRPASDDAPMLSKIEVLPQASESNSINRILLIVFFGLLAIAFIHVF